MTDKVQASDLSWTCPELKSLSEGRISLTQTEGDEIETQQTNKGDEAVAFQHNKQKIPADEFAAHEHQRHHGQEIAEQIEQNDPVEPPPNHDNRVGERDSKNSSRKKRKNSESKRDSEKSSNKKRKSLGSKSTKERKSKSKVWKEFEKCKGENGKELAICKNCRREFDGSSKKGTTHLRNHLKSKICKARKSKQGAGDHEFTGGVGDHGLRERGAITAAVPVKAKPLIDQDLNQLDRKRVVIKNWAPSLKDMGNDIIEVFSEEKEKVRKSLDTLARRFSLSIIWFRKDYYFMAVHFIDDDWEIKKKIIDFQKFDENFVNTLQDSLLEWNLDKNVCSIVKSKDKKQEEFNAINEWLCKQSSLQFCGQWLDVDNWLVDCLGLPIRKEAENLREKIIGFFDYLHQLKALSDYHWHDLLYNNSSCTDSVPKWMQDEFSFFGKAKFFKKKFYGQDWKYPGLEDRNLTEEEWDKTTAMYKCLQVLIIAIEDVLLVDHKTANVYFHEVCCIYMRLLQMEESKNYHVQTMASLMRKEFVRKYWTSYSLSLAIAAVLDPRFKMNIVQCWYSKIYRSQANAELNNLKHNLTTVFNGYCKHANSSSSYKVLDDIGGPHISPDDCVTTQKSELDRYLDEPECPSVKEFNILLWWRDNAENFPTLARMAREFLAISISSTGCVIPLCKKTSIDKLIDNVEDGNLDFDNLFRAFVCTKCWLSQRW